MKYHDHWNLIDVISECLSKYVSWPLTSITIAILMYGIFLILAIKTKYFNPPELYLILLIVLIAYLLWGIQHILDRMKKSIKDIKSYPHDEILIKGLYNKAKNRYNSYTKYIIIIFTILPFLINDMIHICAGGVPLRHFYSNTVWAYIFDFYSYAIAYFMLFLLANILWLVINITWLLDEIKKTSYKRLIEVDIFDMDKTGGLYEINIFTRNVIIYYFICVALVMIYYIQLPITFRLEVIFIIILYYFGLNLFLKEYSLMNVVNRILDLKRDEEINHINRLCQKQHEKLINIICDDKYNYQEGELNWVSTTLERLHNERDIVLSLHREEYSSINIKTLMSSLIIPILTLIINLMFELMKQRIK